MLSYAYCTISILIPPHVQDSFDILKLIISTFLATYNIFGIQNHSIFIEISLHFQLTQLNYLSWTLHFDLDSANEELTQFFA